MIVITETQKEIVSWIKTVIVAIAAAIALNCFVIIHANVPSGSMEDTIATGSRVVGSRLAYLFSEPKRFDVVVFPFPDDESVSYVKRIIGLPGETLDIIDGKVYINGVSESLRDDFVKEIPDPQNLRFEIPEGCYFMLGDNRNVSRDARAWENTFVRREKIKGKLLFSYYPKIKLIK